MIIKEFSTSDNGIDINDNYLIIIGAGVSINAPSCLPGGYELTKYFIDRALGSELSEVFFQQWDKMNELVLKYKKMNFPLVRLESVLQFLESVTYEFNLPKSLECLRKFDEVSYNENHLYLNTLGKKNFKLLTANFDKLIEKVDNKVEVVHFHGTNDHLDSIGATISNIKNGLGFEYCYYINKLIEKEYNLIFVGYSFSDYFDIVPFFEGIASKKIKGDVFFFSHGNPLDLDKQKQIGNIFKGYNSITNLYGNTTEFLRFLVGDVKKVINNSEVIDWKSPVEERYFEFRIFFLIKLFHQSGLEIPNRAMSLIDDGCKEYHSFLECACRKWLEIGSVDFLNKVYDKNKSILSDIIDLAFEKYHEGMYYNKTVQIFKSSKNSNGFESTVKFLSYSDLSNYILAYTQTYDKNCWNFDTFIVYPLVKYCKQFIMEYKDTKDKKNLIQVSKLLNLVLEVPYYNFRYISYYLSLQKVNNILNALLYDFLDMENLNKCYTISLEMSQFVEFIKLCYNELVCMLILEIKFKNKIEQIRNIINLIDDVSNECLVDSIEYIKKKVEYLKKAIGNEINFNLVFELIHI